jgi:hypothetical protein
MTAATLAGLIGAALVGIGLYGLITNPQPLRKILAFNLSAAVFSRCWDHCAEVRRLICCRSRRRRW